MGQALFADQPPVRPRHRGQGVMLVGIERDIFHLLRLLSRLTPLSVSPTHAVTVRARETQRFHAIKTSPVWQVVDLPVPVRPQSRLVISLLLNLFRLLPFLVGGHRQIAL